MLTHIHVYTHIYIYNDQSGSLYIYIYKAPASHSGRLKNPKFAGPNLDLAVFKP